MDEFGRMLKRDNACQFVIVNKTYSNVVLVIPARVNIDEKGIRYRKTMR